MSLRQLILRVFPTVLLTLPADFIRSILVDAHAGMNSRRLREADETVRNVSRARLPSLPPTLRLTDSRGHESCARARANAVPRASNRTEQAAWIE